MKHPFAVSKTNIILAAVCIGIIGLLTFRVNGLSSYAIGTFVGRFVFVLVFPLIVAVLAWFITGRKEGGGQIMFNIVLVILSFGAATNVFDNAKEDRQQLANVQSNIGELRNLYSQDSVPQASVDSVSTAIIKNFNKMILRSSGAEREIIKISKEMFIQTTRFASNWNNSFDRLNNAGLIDYSKIQDTQSRNEQRKIIVEYQKMSKIYLRFFLSRKTILNKKLEHLDPNNPTVVGFKNGFTSKDSIQRPVMISYLKSNINYGQNLLSVLDMFDDPNVGWHYDGTVLEFDNYNDELKYNMLYESMDSNINSINRLHERVLEIM